MEDRRLAKTRMAIRDAFFALLREKSLHRITVSEITRMANLGRGTFYLHYTDVYDLYEKMEDELYEELRALLDESGDASDLMSLSEKIVSYVDSNRNIFLILTRPEASGETMRKQRRFFSEWILQRPLNCLSLTYDDAESLFVASGVLGIVEEWLHEGMATSPQEISASLHRILAKFYG